MATEKKAPAKKAHAAAEKTAAPAKKVAAAAKKAVAAPAEVFTINDLLVVLPCLSVAEIVNVLAPDFKTAEEIKSPSSSNLAATLLIFTDVIPAGSFALL